MTRQELQTAEFVSGGGNAVRTIGRVHVHLLKLPYDRRTKVRDRCPDSGQDGVVVAQVLVAKVEIRLAMLQFDGEAEGVKNFDLMSPVGRRLAESQRAVAVGGGGENGDLHVWPIGRVGTWVGLTEAG